MDGCFHYLKNGMGFDQRSGNVVGKLLSSVLPSTKFHPVDKPGGTSCLNYWANCIITGAKSREIDVAGGSDTGFPSLPIWSIESGIAGKVSGWD